MKKVFSLLIALIFLFSGAIAEGTPFNSMINSKGIVYSLERIDPQGIYEKYPELGDAMFKGGYMQINDNEWVSLSLWKLVVLDKNESIFAIECYYSNIQSHSNDIYFEYGEIPNITKVLKQARESWVNTDQKTKSQFLYTSLSGISFRGNYYQTDPVLKIQFDEENNMSINNIEDLEILINYFEAVEKVVPTL